MITGLWPVCWVSSAWCTAVIGYKTFSNHHITLPAVRFSRAWDEPKDEVKSRPPSPTWVLEDVTACSYSVTKHLSNLVISVLLNYTAFSTELFNMHSTLLVNTKTNERSMACKNEFTAVCWWCKYGQQKTNNCKDTPMHSHTHAHKENNRWRPGTVYNMCPRTQDLNNANSW